MSKKIELICPTCNITFIIYKTKLRQVNYCSHACRGKSLKGKEVPGGFKKNVKPHNYKENLINCSVCNKEFHRSSSHMIGNSSFCSMECRKKQVEYTCQCCGIKFSVRNYRNDVKFCSRSCLAKINLSKYEEYRFQPTGETYRPTRTYRKIMEEHLGRKLSSDEHIHHIDGNPSNNDISNLMILSNAEHSKIHAELRQKRT